MDLANRKLFKNIINTETNHKVKLTITCKQLVHSDNKSS